MFFDLWCLLQVFTLARVLSQAPYVTFDPSSASKMLSLLGVEVLAMVVMPSSFLYLFYIL